LIDAFRRRPSKMEPRACTSSRIRNRLPRISEERELERRVDAFISFVGPVGIRVRDDSVARSRRRIDARGRGRRWRGRSIKETSSREAEAATASAGERRARPRLEANAAECADRFNLFSSTLFARSNRTGRRKLLIVDPMSAPQTHDVESMTCRELDFVEEYRT
jgi:hypothetical protein